MRLSYTNVTATLALFVALGGTSYAAAALDGADVKNGTVTGSDLRSESVTGRDVDNGTLTGSDLKTGSVTTSDLDNGSLLGADFKAGQLPPGPSGPQGPTGTTQALVRRTADVTLNSGERKDVSARCLPGEVAVGGGGLHDAALSEAVSVAYGYPLEADGSAPEDGERPTAWLVGGHNLFFSGVDAKLTAFVLCANA